MLVDPFFNMLAFPNINELIGIVVKFIHPGFVGNIVYKIQVKVRVQGFGIDFLGDELFEVFFAFLEKHVEDQGSGQGISACTVPPVDLNFERAGQFTEAVGRKPGNDVFRGAYGAEVRQAKIIAKAPELMADHVVVETHVMCYKNAVLRKLDDVFGNFVKFGSFFYHFVRDAGKAYDEFRDRTFGIKERGVFVDDRPAIGFIHGNFRNLTRFWTPTRRFDIYNNIMQHPKLLEKSNLYTISGKKLDKELEMQYHSPDFLGLILLLSSK